MVWVPSETGLRLFEPPAAFFYFLIGPVKKQKFVSTVNRLLAHPVTHCLPADMNKNSKIRRMINNQIRISIIFVILK